MSGSLDSPLQFLKGVGPRRAALFERLGVRTVEDLLHHYPRQWQDRHETADLRLPTATGLVVLRGRVLRASGHSAGPRLAVYKATLATAHGKVECVWFKHLSRRFDVFSALKAEVTEGADLWVVGHADPDLTGIREIRVDEHYPLTDERWRTHVARLTPVYALTEGLTQRFVRELTHAALEAHADQATDAVPAALMAKRKLLAAP
ncbi:MAG: hypothetical protein KGL74_03270, partial [Elusimicrobia bacterium]|nr:hypothetical protein [Elusimicrobiota bacterium]